MINHRVLSGLRGTWCSDDCHYPRASDFRALAVHAAQAATDIEAAETGAEPSVLLALIAGIEDVSYSTVRCGPVEQFRGEARLYFGRGYNSRGPIWIARGYEAQGSEDWVARPGTIIFQKEQSDD